MTEVYVKLAMARAVQVALVCPECREDVAVTTLTVKPRALDNNIIRCSQGHPMRVPEDKRLELFKLRRV